MKISNEKYQHHILHFTKTDKTQNLGINLVKIFILH